MESIELLPKSISSKFDLSSLKANNVFVLGIGGGSDVVGAFGVATLLQSRKPDSNVSYGVCVSRKENYAGFERLSENLFRRSSPVSNNVEGLHTSLSLMIKMKEYDSHLPSPYLLTRPPKYGKVKDIMTIGEYNQEVRNAFFDVIDLIKPELTIAVDMGGDSLTCGIEDEYSFDRTGLRALKQLNKPFIYVVLGVGCDGESTIEMMRSAIDKELQAGSILGEFPLDEIVELMFPVSKATLAPDRTPNIIAEAKYQLDKNPELATQLVTIQRHRKPSIPVGWINKGIAFDGLILTIDP